MASVIFSHGFRARTFFCRLVARLGLSQFRFDVAITSELLLHAEEICASPGFFTIALAM
jgi:hypothetical protein